MPLCQYPYVCDLCIGGCVWDLLRPSAAAAAAASLIKNCLQWALLVVSYYSSRRYNNALPCSFHTNWILCACAVKYSATDVYDGNFKLKQLKVGCPSGCAGMCVLLTFVPRRPACHVSVCVSIASSTHIKGVLVSKLYGERCIFSTFGSFKDFELSLLDTVLHRDSIGRICWSSICLSHSRYTIKQPINKNNYDQTQSQRLLAWRRISSTKKTWFHSTTHNNNTDNNINGDMDNNNNKLLIDIVIVE